MKVSVDLGAAHVDLLEEFCTAPAFCELAAAAERFGSDSCYVTDHPIPGDDTHAYGGHHTLDPFVFLSIVAAATTRLRLRTYVLVLPYRNPFLTAKAVASLDVASGGRVIVGVGTGYGEAEFAALGVDFAERNELTDEAIVVIKQAWTGESLALQGRHFMAPGNTSLPVPAQRPHPPIWVGGNSKRAIRRAVELGQGWCPFANPPIVFRPFVAQPAPDSASLSLADVSRPVILAEEIIENAAALAEAGVTYLSMGPIGPAPARTRAAYIENLDWFSREVLPGLTAL